MNQTENGFFEKRLLSLAIEKQTCLIEWMEGTSDRFVSYDPSFAKKLKEISRRTVEIRDKMSWMHSHLLDGSDSRGEDYYKHLNQEHEGKFYDEDHFFVVDRPMACRLLGLILGVVDDTENFFFHCHEQSRVDWLQSFYADISAVLHGISRTIQEKVADYGELYPFLAPSRLSREASRFGGFPN